MLPFYKVGFQPSDADSTISEKSFIEFFEKFPNYEIDEMLVTYRQIEVPGEFNIELFNWEEKELNDSVDASVEAKTPQYPMIFCMNLNASADFLKQASSEVAKVVDHFGLLVLYNDDAVPTKFSEHDFTAKYFDTVNNYAALQKSNNIFKRGLAAICFAVLGFAYSSTGLGIATGLFTALYCSIAAGVLQPYWSTHLRTIFDRAEDETRRIRPGEIFFSNVPTKWVPRATIAVVFILPLFAHAISWMLNR